MDGQRMNYSRRQLYALGEPLGESTTRLKLGGRIYGGGGGGGFVEDFVSDVGDAAGDVVGGAGDVLSEVVGGVGDVVGDVVEGAGDVVEGVAGGVGDVVGGIGDAVGGIGDTIGDIGSSIDDTVRDVIPGGWTTLAEIGIAMTPLGPMGSAGFGALSGGTGGFKKGKFDLTGAIMGGLQGYGVGSMTNSLASAGAPNPYGSGANYDITTATGPEAFNTPPTDVGYVPPADYSITSATPPNPAGISPVDYSLASSPTLQPTDINPFATAGRDVASVELGSGLSPTIEAPGAFQSPAPGQYPTGGELGVQAEFTPAKVTPPSGLENLTSSTMDKASQVGQGLKNLTGFGPEGLSGIGTAAENINAGMSMTAYSGLGAVVLEDMARKNMQDYESGQITDTEFLKNQQMIKDAIAQAEANVKMHPYEKDPSLTAEQGTLYDKSGMGAYQEYYAKNNMQPQPNEVLTSEDSYNLDDPYGFRKSQKTLYASGGTVANYEPSEDMMSGGLANGFSFAQGGDVPAYGIGSYARGGEPRFLSGGGDGMSDSIRANIDGKQEARLADGEFVIPADVVSHLGNGSSKAGAKQLHAMMNRIRKARTGNPKQGKQINPTKLMPA
jgi:hypothetical protein